MICRQGEIVMVDFNPSAGHEPAKMRPAVVVSCDRSNLMPSPTMVTPVTSTDNGHPLHVRIHHPDVTGRACVEQASAVDLTARRCEHIGTMREDDMNEIPNLLGAVHGI